MNLKRRDFLVVGAVTPLLIASGCSASAATVLSDIDTVLGDAEAVIKEVEATTTLAAPVFTAVNAWLGLVKAATDQALVIDNGAVKLTAQQVTAIIALYSQAIVFNIPGIPLAIEAAINAAIAAIKVLLNLLHPASGAAAPNGILVTLTPGGRVKHFLVKRHAATFGSHLTTMHQRMAGKLTASALPAFGAKGFGS